MTKNPLTRGLPPVHPGAILREETLPNLVHADTGKKVLKVELAAALEITRQALDLILNEKRPVSPDTAVRLAKITGSRAEFWLDLQARYDLQLAASKIDVSAVPTFKVAA